MPRPCPKTLALFSAQTLRRFLARATITGAACAALVGCATLNVDTASTPLSTEIATAPLLSPDSPELSGKEVITLPRPAGLGAFDFTSAIMSGSASNQPPPPIRAPVRLTSTNLYDVVSVYWGTDRRLNVIPLADAATGRITTGSVSTITPPGAERGDTLLLGRARVTVPKTAREKGEVKRPFQITFLSYTLYRETEDPRSHFTLGKLERMDEADFTQSSNQHLANAKRFKDEAFIFVHGFNMSFENALFRTAQIAYDLEFDGVPYLYSWPSKGQTAGYLYDRDSADRARRYFLKFVEMVAAKTSARKIHIIAHSLGARPLVEALNQANQTPGRVKKLKLGEIILAAPDIDRDVFKEIANVITTSGTGTTLYAADNDRPLQLSRILAGGKARAGEVTKAGPMVMKDIDTIDISNAGTDALLSLHHNTYADSSHLLDDMRALFKKGLRPPSKRSKLFKLKTLPAGNYWKFATN